MLVDPYNSLYVVYTWQDEIFSYNPTYGAHIIGFACHRLMSVVTFMHNSLGGLRTKFIDDFIGAAGFLKV